MLHFSGGKFYRLQRINEERISEFLDYLELFTCRRCWSNQVEGPNKTQPYHHHGVLSRWLTAARPVDEASVARWATDTQDGLLHGFLAAYFAYHGFGMAAPLFDETMEWWRPQGAYNLDLERVIMSCLFHGFLKSNGSDGDLKEFMDFLDPITYNLPSTEDNPVAVGDQIDSTRGAVHQERYGHEELGHFFRHIRPAMEKLLRHKDEIWASHTIESIDCHDIDHYPKGHWTAVDYSFSPSREERKLVSSYMSVNSGRLWQDCLHHNQTGMLQGLISKSCLKRTGSFIDRAPDTTWGRDHLFVVQNGKIPLADWVMLYDSISELQRIDCDKIHTMSRPLFRRMYHVIENFLSRVYTLMVQ